MVNDWQSRRPIITQGKKEETLNIMKSFKVKKIRKQDKNKSVSSDILYVYI